MKKPFLIMTALSAVVSLSLAGCSSVNTTKPTKFTQAQETAYMKSFMTLVSKPSAPSVIIQQINANIDKLNTQDASNSVDGLLYVIHQDSQELNGKIQGLQQSLKQNDANGMDFNDPSKFDKISDETLKAFLDEVHKDYFTITDAGSQYLAVPNIQWVVNTYGKYMKPDLKTMANFSIEQNQQQFFNPDTNSFDMNLVAQRIIELEGDIKKFPNSYYATGMKQSKDYYYQVYFGTNNQFLVDKSNKVLPKIIQSYQGAIQEYPNSQLAKDLKAYLSKLKASHDVITPDINIYLLGLTNTQTTGTAQPASPAVQQSNKQLNNAIQSAIKANR